MGFGAANAHDPEKRSFLLLFFKKEVLPISLTARGRVC
jgi:hypothetical protein